MKDTQKASVDEFMRFVEKSATAYQAVEETKHRLLNAGYRQLFEREQWEPKAGDHCFVTRGDSSLIAFCIPPNKSSGFHMICAHTDSPAFKLKENPQMNVEDAYLKLNTEKYGGMLMESWLDRPLSVAGRIVVRDRGERTDNLKTILVDMEEPLFIIPSLAIHMKRGDAKENALNPQLHLLPLAGTQPKAEQLMELVAKRAGVKAGDILGTDLFLYNPQKPVRMGLNGELLGSARLDDLECVYCGLDALLRAKPVSKTAVLAVFDNEEVGSSTMQGAGSNFLWQTLERIGKEELPRLLADSFLLSADNAHALHPNYMDKADPTNRPKLNGGIVIKYHGGQKYTTSAYSGAFVKLLCEQAGVKYQTYHNRSDVAGGSTLGNIALSAVSVPAADIGFAQLAMHSAFETAGAEDFGDMCLVMQHFLET